MFYDWLITLPAEISHVWLGKRNTATYLYIATRYTGLITYGLNVYPLLASGVPILVRSI